MFIGGIDCTFTTNTIEINILRSIYYEDLPRFLGSHKRHYVRAPRAAGTADASTARVSCARVAGRVMYAILMILFHYI